jgi:tetratricopeptide (TPR) repeat protein
VFTAGFPLASRQFSFGQGEALAVVNRRIQGDKGGYSIIYDAWTLPGMSGGGVFNSDGHLVAIHGLGDRISESTLEVVAINIGSNDNEDGFYNILDNTKTGDNRGIPVRWLVEGLREVGITVGQGTLPPVVPVQAPKTADEYFISGLNEYMYPRANLIASRKEVVQFLMKAIQLNPQYSYAYSVRAAAYNEIGEFQKSLADFNKAIALDPNYAAFYHNRGILKETKLNDLPGALADYKKAVTFDHGVSYYNRGSLKETKLNDSQGALADFNKAIALDPSSPLAYIARGLLKETKLNDPQGALADFNKLITINPNYAPAYTMRGTLKISKLNDPQGALADCNKAIAINPNYASAYTLRGFLKQTKLNDPQGALADYNKSIGLDQRSANALKLSALTYRLRGSLKQSKLNDSQGALADYNKAIILNPKFVEAYINRGNLKQSKLNDPQGALADYNKAIALNPKNADLYATRGVLKQSKMKDYQADMHDNN